MFSIHENYREEKTEKPKDNILVGWGETSVEVRIKKKLQIPLRKAENSKFCKLRVRNVLAKQFKIHCEATFLTLSFFLILQVACRNLDSFTTPPQILILNNAYFRLKNTYISLKVREGRLQEDENRVIAIAAVLTASQQFMRNKKVLCQFICYSFWPY